MGLNSIGADSDLKKAEEPTTPTPMAIYLAGPIDQVGSKQDGKEAPAIESWKQDLIALLSHLPVVCFDPFTAFKLSGRRATWLSKYIYEVNTQAMEKADIVVAYLPKGVPAIGTSNEIYESVGKRILFIITEFAPGESVALDGMIHCKQTGAPTAMGTRTKAPYPMVYPIHLDMGSTREDAWRKALGATHDIINMLMGGSRENDVLSPNLTAAGFDNTGTK